MSTVALPNILWKNRVCLYRPKDLERSSSFRSNDSIQVITECWTRWGWLDGDEHVTGAYEVWEVLWRGWDPAPGKKGKRHHYLDLGTLDHSDPGCHGTSRPIVSGMEQEKTSTDSQQWRKRAPQEPVTRRAVTTLTTMPGPTGRSDATWHESKWAVWEDTSLPLTLEEMDRRDPGTVWEA